MAAVYKSETHRDFDGIVTVNTDESMGNQLMPSIGIKLRQRLWWRIHLSFDFFYVIGQRPYQRMFFDYSYKGVEQPRGEWYSDGSGYVRTIGVAVRLFD